MLDILSSMVFERVLYLTYKQAVAILNKRVKRSGEELREENEHNNEGKYASGAHTVFKSGHGLACLIRQNTAKNGVSVYWRDRYEVEKAQGEIHEHYHRSQARKFGHSLPCREASNKSEQHRNSEVCSHSCSSHNSLSPSLIL